MKKGIVIVVVLVALILVARWKLTSGRSAQDPNQLTLSGNVDIREVVLGFRVPGRITEISHEEGDAVRKDDILARLDSEPFERDMDAARAQVAAAEARLRMFEAGYRQQEIDQAKAVLNERETACRNAEKIYRRQEQLAATNANAQQERDDAESSYREAESRVNSAREQLNLLQAGYRPEEIAAARAEAQRAKASQSQLQLRLDDTVLRAAEAGVVLTRSQEPGAIVQAGTPVLTLSLMDPVWVRTYLHEADLGRVRPGMPVQVFSDARPDRPFKGQLGYISPRAEFTPRNVETVELRTSLVYRTRIVVEDPNRELRQGMPVTVRIPLQGTNAAITKLSLRVSG